MQTTINLQANKNTEMFVGLFVGSFLILKTEETVVRICDTSHDNSGIYGDCQCDFMNK